MEKLKSLVAIYFIFILLSLVTGFGLYLVDDTYAKLATGSLLILSSFVTLLIFVDELTDNGQ